MAQFLSELDLADDAVSRLKKVILASEERKKSKIFLLPDFCVLSSRSVQFLTEETISPKLCAPKGQFMYLRAAIFVRTGPTI